MNRRVRGLRTLVGLVALMVMLVVITSGCTAGAGGVNDPSAVALSTAGDPMPSIAIQRQADPRGIRIEGRGVSVDLPAGAVPQGQEFTVGIGEPIGRVQGGGRVEVFGAPVEIDHQVDLAAPARIAWDVSELTPEQRSSLVLVRWDLALGVWRVVGERPVLEGTTLTADVTQFSTIDWVSSGAASVSQTVGQWSGKRAEAPRCSSAPLPGWVREVVRPDDGQAAMPVRTCVEPDKNDVLTVRVANNRPYTQALDLERGDRYAWTWAGDSDFTPSGIIGDTINQLLSSESTLVMAPTRATAVGLARPSTPGEVRLTMTPHPTVATVAEDILVYVLGNVLSLDSVGGFDSESLNRFVQSVYDCGGKQVLKSRDVASADTFEKVLETVKSCGDSDAVRSAIEDVLRQQIAKGGKAATDAVQTNRLLHQVLGKLGIYLKAVDFFSYVTELGAGVALGPSKIDVFGTGMNAGLGDWRATCSDPDQDSNLLYKNLALQDTFKDKSKELWQFPTWKTSSVKAVQPLGTCKDSHIERVAAKVETTWADKKAASIVAASIRALRKEPSGGILMSGQGIGEHRFDRAGYVAVEQELTKALGKPSSVTERRDNCAEMNGSGGSGAWERIVTWGSLRVEFRTQDGAEETDPKTLAQWSVDLTKPFSDQLKLPNGVPRRPTFNELIAANAGTYEEESGSRRFYTGSNLTYFGELGASRPSSLTANWRGMCAG